MQTEFRAIPRQYINRCQAMVFSHESFAMGYVTNINSRGLQLEYQSPGAEPGQWKSVDIYVQGESRLYVLGIPCKLCYDVAESSQTQAVAGQFCTRVAGLKFGMLSVHQEKRLLLVLKQINVNIEHIICC